MFFKSKNLDEQQFGVDTEEKYDVFLEKLRALNS